MAYTSPTINLVLSSNQGTDWLDGYQVHVHFCLRGSKSVASLSSVFQCRAVVSALPIVVVGWTAAGQGLVTAAAA